MTFFMSGNTYDYDLRVRDFEPKDITFKIRRWPIFLHAVFLLLWPIGIVIISFAFAKPFSPPPGVFMLYVVAPLFLLAAFWELYGLRGSRNLSVNKEGFVWTGHLGPQKYLWLNCSEFSHSATRHRRGQPKIIWAEANGSQKPLPQQYRNFVNNTDLELSDLCVVMNLYREHALLQS